MSVFPLRSLLVVSILAGLTAPAAAQGMFLKLATDDATVAVDEPLKVRLTAVVTRTFPALEPEFLVDDGTGMKVRPEVKVKALDATRSEKISSGAPNRTSWELELPNPGRYRIRVRARYSDRVIESNKLSVEVAAPAKVAAQP
jgi:hypothetical protein